MLMKTMIRKVMMMMMLMVIMMTTMMIMKMDGDDDDDDDDEDDDNDVDDDDNNHVFFIRLLIKQKIITYILLYRNALQINIPIVVTFSVSSSGLPYNYAIPTESELPRVYGIMSRSNFGVGGDKMCLR